MLAQTTAVMCVLGLAVGQILFKVAAISLQETGSLFVWRTMSALMLAMLLYGLTSLAWVWVLQKVDLGRVYPLMALAFVLVPLGSHWVFGERFQPQYFAGVTLIVVGIVIAIR